MSKISLEPNASGAGTFTLAAPNSNTNRTLTLPDESGTIFSDGTGVPGSAVTGQLASSNMPAGSVIQVVTKTINTLLVLSDTTYADIPGFDITMTLNDANNKVLLFTHFGMLVGGEDANNNSTQLRYTRNGSAFSVGVSSGIRVQGSSVVSGHRAHINNAHGFQHDLNVVDDNPGSTNVTYKVQHRNEQGNLYLNRTQRFDDDDRPHFGTFSSTMIAMEIVT